MNYKSQGLKKLRPEKCKTVAGNTDTRVIFCDIMQKGECTCNFWFLIHFLNNLQKKTLFVNFFFVQCHRQHNHCHFVRPLISEVGVGVRWDVDSFCLEVPSILIATCCNIHGI